MFALFFLVESAFLVFSKAWALWLQPPFPDAIWHLKPWLFPGRALLGHWKQKRRRRKEAFLFHIEVDLQINPKQHSLFLTFSKFQLLCWPASLQGAALNQLSLIRPLTLDAPPRRPRHRLLDWLNFASTRKPAQMKAIVNDDGILEVLGSSIDQIKHSPLLPATIFFTLPVKVRTRELDESSGKSS